jgi:hypothetical protein
MVFADTPCLGDASNGSNSNSNSSGFGESHVHTQPLAT